jgi:hypothetical protein
MITRKGSRFDPGRSACRWTSFCGSHPRPQRVPKRRGSQAIEAASTARRRAPTSSRCGRESRGRSGSSPTGAGAPGVETEVPREAAEPYAIQISGSWARAAELWTEIGCPYEAALALVDADDDDALRRALDEFQRLGAAPAAEIVARRMRERGLRGVPPATAKH